MSFKEYLKEKKSFKKIVTEAKKKPVGEFHILIDYIDVTATEDSYEEGETGSPRTLISENIGKTFKTWEEAKSYLVSKYSLPKEIDAWGTMDGEEGRIDVQQQLNDEGYPPSPQEIKDWKNGKGILYSGYTVIGIRFAKVYSPSSDEVSKVCGGMQIL